MFSAVLTKFLQTMGANVKMAETMGSTAKVMGNMNKLMNPEQVQALKQEVVM